MRVIGVAAVRKALHELLERRERLAHLLRIALREVELVHVTEESLVFAKVDESFQIIGVIDVRMVRIGADETIAGRRGGRLLSRLQDGQVQKYLRVIGLALTVLLLLLTWGRGK